MNLKFTWQVTTDPRKHGHEYLRVNGICVGYISNEWPAIEPWMIHFYLPQEKPRTIRFTTKEQAVKALEKAVNDWFERFK